MNSLSLYRNIKSLITLEAAYHKKGRHIRVEDLSILSNAALISDSEGRILFVGAEKKINSFLKSKSQKFKIKEYDLSGCTVLPGFVDCHTHTVFAGQRYDEFELRNQGISYQQIAAQGGGILSTMKATRNISMNQLFEISKQRLKKFYEQGVTTLEIKSGYSLDLKNELKQLKVIQKLNDLRLSRCVSTFLGAHALPPEFKSYEQYLETVALEWLPKIKKSKLTNRVDIFIEKGFFEKSAAKKYLLQAQQMGFDIAIHADQLSLSGGSELALELNALSADHMIQVGEEQIKKFSEQTQTTSVLLPTADLYLKCNYPPARQLIDAGARVALATDFNPGSSPTQDISLMGLLARLYMKMTLPEVIGAYTLNGAYALGLQNEIGVLRVGHRAEFITTDFDWQGLFYEAGKNPILKIFKPGSPESK